MNNPDDSSRVASERDIRRAAAAWVARRDAGLSATDAREFERWRGADPRHEAALAHFDSAWSVLAAPRRTGAGDLLEEELAQLARQRRRRRATGVTVAAMLALMLVGFAAWIPRSAKSEAIHPTAAILRPRIETLPDGSRVELNADAEIAVAYTADVRRVALRRGEAHFTVRKDAARPFVVSAEGIDVRAVGTAFNVQIGSAVVAVLVTEGTVAVEKLSLPASEAVLAAASVAVVHAGQEVKVGRTTAPQVETAQPVSSSDATSRLAWRETRLEFTRTPLPAAVAVLNRHASPSSPRLVAADPALAAVEVTGLFRPGNIAGFVHLMEAGFGVRAERSGDTITLRVAR